MESQEACGGGSPDLTLAHVAPGSFRDPQGQVLELGERVYRALYAPVAPFPQTWAEEGPLAKFFSDGRLWPARPLSRGAAAAELLNVAPCAIGFLEQPRLTPITYPYEWPFALLKRAALLHLELHREALAQGLTLADGSAYNIQFVGTRPVFIDTLAFIPFVEGQQWAGYSQFCELFLNPLLLAAQGSSAWVDVYRGSLRGVSTREAARQLGWWRALRAGAFMHVIVNSLAAGRASNQGMERRPTLSRAGLELMLTSLRRAIERLELPSMKRDWAAYEQTNSYSEDEKQAKHCAVQAFIERTRPVSLLDIGCNTGEYAQVALDAGVSQVVGLERDPGAIDRAVSRADRLSKPFLPLQIDIQNPSPDQGWDLAERTSLRSRFRADAVLSLALVHHLVLGEGIPLAVIMRGIVALAPCGAIEFVPREDPMAQRIAGSPNRMTHAYDLAIFQAELSKFAVIEKHTPLTATGRVLVEYRRKS